MIQYNYKQILRDRGKLKDSIYWKQKEKKDGQNKT